MTGKFENDEFVASPMDHSANKYDRAIGFNPPTWGSPRVGHKVDEFQWVAQNI